MIAVTENSARVWDRIASSNIISTWMRNINFPIRPFIELTWDQIEAKILGEMKALYNCSQAVLKDMINRKSGKLIFVSSSLSRFPGNGFSAHAATKSAMDSMAKVMAMELGPSGITVMEL